MVDHFSLVIRSLNLANGCDGLSAAILLYQLTTGLEIQQEVLAAFSKTVEELFAQRSEWRKYFCRELAMPDTMNDDSLESLAVVLGVTVEVDSPKLPSVLYEEPSILDTVAMSLCVMQSRPLGEAEKAAFRADLEKWLRRVAIARDRLGLANPKLSALRACYDS